MSQNIKAEADLDTAVEYMEKASTSSSPETFENNLLLADTYAVVSMAGTLTEIYRLLEQRLTNDK